MTERQLTLQRVINGMNMFIRGLRLARGARYKGHMSPNDGIQEREDEGTPLVPAMLRCAHCTPDSRGEHEAECPHSPRGGG